jgi:hypothetical protein
VDFGISFLCILGLVVVEILEEHIGFYGRLKTHVKPLKWAYLIGLLLLILFLGLWEEADFLYFQF